ncbi:hypothetical protein [Brevibacillus migulae]|uniref:hypothetical protein n=1 Tax=Brevibacillus migulae TaxID=1644114 RepID=UPI00106EF0B7|nr:hypothetical protein [Brevibacillus migulae]
MFNNFQSNAFTGAAQSVFQPGFAGTDAQQVRNQIARDGGFGYGQAYQTTYATPQFSNVPVGLQSGAQAIFQPGFAGTDPQQVRNQIARDLNPGVQSYQNTFTSQQFGGVPVGLQSGAAQAIFQPGFAGTDPQQVRSQIARELNYGYANQALPTSYQGTAAYQSNVPVGVPAAVSGGVQAVFQPGFAGTEVQQVRNQIARDGGFGYGATAYQSNQSLGAVGVPAAYQTTQTLGAVGVPAAVSGGVQAIFQPGFAGTDVQQVRNQIARDGGYGYGYATNAFQPNQGLGTVGVPAAVSGGVQAVFQPGFAGTDVQQVQNQIARDGGFGYGAATTQVPYPVGVGLL